MSYYQGDVITNQPLRVFAVCPDCKDMHLLDMTAIGLGCPSFYFVCGTCGLHSWVRGGVATGFDIRALAVPLPQASVAIAGYDCGDHIDGLIQDQSRTDKARASRIVAADAAIAASQAQWEAGRGARKLAVGLR